MKERYAAFISYSHSDEVSARWLQRSLERFRVPNAVRKNHADLPRRIFPVFRDKNELASSTDLSESIKNHLQRSDALLVVCSPRAAASKWVNQEILAFRQLSPGAPVLCLLVDGSPEKDAPDCAFPQALLFDQHGNPAPEPLAADLRDSADGRRGALLKISAGLLNVGVDDLRQRDTRRRMRVMGAFSGAALLIAVTTSLLALNAIQARKESDVRRTQAEDLIDFMLVDLRDQLEPIGRLNILDSVGVEAMGYFEKLGSLGTDRELLSRAMALRQIGEVNVGQGKLEVALRAFVQSRDLNMELAKRQPGNNGTLFELGQAEYWVGYVALERAHPEQALQAMQQYFEISAQLNEREPGNPDYRLELAYANQNLAALALKRHESDQALSWIEESLVHFHKLVGDYPDEPGYALELANALSWQGSMLEASGEWLKSIQAFKEGQGLLNVIIMTSDDAFDTAALGEITLVLASGFSLIGDDDAALTNYRAANRLYRELVAVDSTNVLWQEGLARSYGGIGRVLAHRNEHPGSLEQFMLAKMIWDQVGSADQSNAIFEIKRAWIHALVAVSALDNGNTTLATENLDMAILIATASMERLQPGTLPRIELPQTWDAIGEVHARLDRFKEARAAWLTGLSLLEGHQEMSGGIEAMYVRLLHRVGRGDETGEQLRLLLESGLRNPDFLPRTPDPGGQN